MTKPVFEPKSFTGRGQAAIVNVRCPSCKRNGSFHGYPEILDVGLAAAQIVPPGSPRTSISLKYGIRSCPNPECKEPLFVICDGQYKVTKTYPAEELDFEPAGIPARILASFEEAIKCHSISCFKASALMVRRTLEEVCGDQSAKGKDLKERIAALGEKIIVPRELLEAANELRLLGNDAAHLEAKVYDDVGKVELDLAIELTKEILKAVYQLADLLERLKSLKSKT